MSEKLAVAEKQLVMFNLGAESYAVDITIVREIIQMQPITRVPGTPHSMEGVINLRGSVIPIIDLHKRFQLSQTTRSKEARIVVVNCLGQDVGVIVDSVAEVLRVPLDSIEPSASLFNGGHTEHVRGIAKLKDKLVILLDMDRVISKQDLTTINSLELNNNPQDTKTTKQPVLA